MTKIEVVFNSGNDLLDKTYEGRLLPFVNSGNFIDLIHDRVVRNKLFTTETIEVSSIIKDMLLKDDKTKGLRLALAIKKINGEDCGTSKRLFISEPLHFVSYASPDKKEVSFSTENGKGWVKIRDGV